jgi:hypothetical protein
MPAIATFPNALDADLEEAPGGPGKRSTQVIGVAIDDGDGATPATNRLLFLIVDHEGHAHLVPASRVTFTDDKVMPPKYG